MKEIVLKYSSEPYDLSCSETMVYSANEKWNLGLEKESFKMMAPFSGGMGIESICGIVTGAISVLGIIFVDKCAHESDFVSKITKEYISKFDELYSTISCNELKKNYRDDVLGCSELIMAGALLLEKIVEKYKEEAIIPIR